MKYDHAVTITFTEAAALGVLRGSINNWGERLRPLAIEKGVPAERLYTGSLRVMCVSHENGMDICWNDNDCEQQ